MKTVAPARLWSLLDCRTDAPQSDAPGQRSWIARTAYFTVVLTEIDGQASLPRTDNPDEYMAVIPAGIRAIAQAGEETLGSDGDALFIVPPGDSTLEVQGKGMVVRVFSHLASDLACAAANQADYARPVGDIAPYRRWPVPEARLRLQCHALADHVVPSNGISRVFRSTNLMLNVMVPYDAPRDPRILKPHSHADYEQITICMQGRFAHHLRTPWTVDSTQWREDAHLEVDSPSTLVIPARLIHTTQALEAGCWLIDVFGPPREDFSSIPGFVRNAQDYPMPEPALQE
ncbi:hypothetical protein [Paracandidimonas soli]|uniref:hypothetical protein n=1 Tax=Paracandidimonas soli TaxID=1917182 RepID=UPI00333FBFD2